MKTNRFVGLNSPNVRPSPGFVAYVATCSLLVVTALQFFETMSIRQVAALEGVVGFATAVLTALTYVVTRLLGKTVPKWMFLARHYNHPNWILASYLMVIVISISLFGPSFFPMMGVGWFYITLQAWYRFIKDKRRMT